MSVNRESMVYIGPPQDKLEEEFMAIFGEAVALEADDFALRDSPHNEALNLQEMARSRGIHIDPADLAKLPMTRLLPAGHAEFWQKYKSFRQHRQGARGSFVADTSQDPDHRPRCGAWFPSLARASTIRSLSSEHTFTKKEVDCVMGFPSLDFAGCAPYKQCFPFDVTALPRYQCAALQGNGIQCAALFCSWSFILSHCLRRSDIERFDPLLLSMTDADAQADLDEEGDSDGVASRERLQ